VVKPYVPQSVNDFNDDEFANIDPFKSKPKVGIETTPTNNSVDTSYADKINDNLTTPTNESATSTVSVTKSIDEHPDEWESHKKRGSMGGRKSFTKMIDESTKTSQQDTSPPTKQTSSIVSSSTDLSSSVSSSPPPSDNNQVINPLLVLSATSTSSFSSSNTNSTSSIGNVNKLNDEINFQTPKHQTFSNTQSDDLRDEATNEPSNELLNEPLNEPSDDQFNELSQEKINQLKQCQFIESSSRSELNDVDNLIDFNKLHDMSASADDKINETNDFKTDENMQTAVNSVVFDSIFSNDNGMCIYKYTRFSIILGFVREKRSQFN